ncbi:MAG TPA: ABC transporter permease [Candidatus Limnocylindria bacterium]|nr:ABC transporter permease [Candidatus Limnocylindria bacterium]
MTERAMRPGRSPLEDELRGIDNLELPLQPHRARLAALWSGLWPKLAAVGIFLLVWQIVVWAQIRPAYVLPGPLPVLERLAQDITGSNLPQATGITLQRAAIGFGLALLIGSLLGLAIVRSRLLRTAVASLITGLQTMPSIAWFPLAILLFGLNETAIMFVVVLGAAPSIANGLIAGVDHIPRVLLRAGQVLGARGFARYRHVIFPAALPSFVGGLKQGWAFCWRSLMAGELLVIIAAQPSIGVRLQFAREFSDALGLMSTMIVILVIGIVVDILFFGTLDRAIRRRWGLLESG